MSGRGGGQWRIVSRVHRGAALADVEIVGDDTDVGVDDGTVVLETWSRDPADDIRLDFVGASTLASTIGADIEEV